ncbi:MAG: GTPase domain-containing protein [Burkholderiales bacterium]|nr:GTPase domain-containing protein [Burkholderiales bacterium]
MSDASRSIALSLVSHTNVGKTTLARTLLGHDIGEVRDAAHVTELAEAHTMMETAEGDALLLWDTPGFGDSARLAKRLAQSGNPIGWFLSEVWDRWRDRPFWSSQQAVKNVRGEADVVLYLVSAAEDPRDAGYVAPEMKILEWIGKPVIVLLNQVGEPRPRAEEQAEEERWRDHVGRHRFVREVLTLDAFARAWVQELELLRAVERALPAAKRPALARLAAAWQAKRMHEFEASMDALAEELARAAFDREPVGESGVKAALREVGNALGLGREGETSAKDRAMQRLAERLDTEIRIATDRLIAANGLAGRAAAEVLQRLAGDYAVSERVSEGKAAALGGLVSGALSGLAADLAAGGLTLGAGMLAGGLLGALGGAGLARGYNLVRGARETTVCWSDEFLDGLFASALLRYLAVAHYGRGRGEWQAAEHPAFWREEVARVVAPRRDALAAIWAERGGDCDAARLAAALRNELAAAALDVLERLYPGALGVRDQDSGFGIRDSGIGIQA